MKGDGFNRRNFLQVLGLGGGAAALSGCGNTSIESGAELVESYVQPESFVVPGVGVYYASTCTQCPSGCGVMGRVREGRILKLEGNPHSATSGGKICGLGQAAVQQHYSPDRLQTPMMRSGGQWVATTWDKAMALLAGKLGDAAAGQAVWLTGPMSGHQQILLRNLVEASPASGHVVYDALSTHVESATHQKIYGVEHPIALIDQAGIVLSFGNDFLGAGASPVDAARQYARFRKARPRGVLVQVEPRMTLTGANADRWLVIAPGTEGVLALGLARELLQRKDYAGNVSAELQAAVAGFDKETVARITGVRPDMITHLVSLLWAHAPALVLAGRYPLGQAHGSQNAAAIALLNVILQAQGKTLMRQADLPFPQMAPSSGDTRSLVELNKQMADGKVRAVMFHHTNPVFTAPKFMKFADNLQKVPFKAAWVVDMDETAQQCDLVLPLLSALEDFGTHVAGAQHDGFEISFQQPLMEKMVPEARSFGDTLLDLIKGFKADAYKAFPDYYAYLKSAIINSKQVFDPKADNEDFWEDTLSSGVLHTAATLQPLAAAQIKPAMLQQPAAAAEDAKYPYTLIPSVRQSFRDGRSANLPWLQESPDPLTTIVWDSWVELHPGTAKELGIREGDVLEISSSQGTVKAKAYLMPGIHPKCLSIPVGQGHQSYGRYATHVGVNPLEILDPVFDADTGELALYATRVAMRKTDEYERVNKDEGATNLQQNRKLVAVVSPDQASLTKEIPGVIR